MSRVSTTASFFALALTACVTPPSPQDVESNTSEGSSTGAPAAGTSEGTTAATIADESTSTSPDEVVDEGPTIFDVIGLPDAPPIDEGCSAVDFLFVIDDSGSMYDEQVKLAANFPVFSSGIQSTLEDVTSYQVGVVATDAYLYNDPPCGELGDLVVSTQGGYDSSDMVCGPYEDGHNYMTEADDLGTAFACAAQLGTFGDGYERPMEAMVRTVGDFHDGEGECNEGFIRDEALLVIVVITDEHDGMGDPEGFGGSSVGDPDTWYDAVVAAKGGIEQNAVVMSLINYHAEGDEDPSPCVPTDPYADGVHIKRFTQKFGNNGFVGGICQADYGPIFEQAIGVIATACDNFIPPG
jgi:hypothetical protein